MRGAAITILDSLLYENEKMHAISSGNISNFQSNGTSVAITNSINSGEKNYTFLQFLDICVATI